MSLPSALSKFQYGVKSLLKSVLQLVVIDKFSDTDNTIFLTFDDGPHRNTEVIYETLKDMGINAGFFFNGNAVLNHRELVQRIYNDGYFVGNHSFNHSKYSWRQWIKELKGIKAGERILSSITCSCCKVYRPPYGNIKPIILAYLLANKYKILLWSIDSRDFEATEVNEILDNISNIVGGDVILFHSDCDITATHIKTIIYALSAKGYRFGNLSEVLPC